MTTLPVVLFIFLLLATLWKSLARDFHQGLAYAVFLCIVLTTYLRIEMPGNLPEMTIHRLILISVAVFWFLKRHEFEAVDKIPLKGLFLFWAAANLASLLVTRIDFVTSLKRYMDFILETSVFYFIAASSLTRKDDIFRMLKAAVLGLTVVGILAAVEKYTGFNPVDRFIPGYVRDDVAGRDVIATFPHRILLGTAMAMGIPLAFALKNNSSQESEPVRWIWVSIIVLASACYFAMSRGPWIGLSIACCLLLALGSGQVRKALGVVVVLMLLVFIIKPGVFDTITGLAKDTADADSFKGGTFQYRMELWVVAFKNISASFTTFLFGNGPGAGSAMELNWELSYRGQSRQIESWDNHYAYAMFQSGMVGLAAILLLYFQIVWKLFRYFRTAPEHHKDTMLGILASAIVLVFMMSNVLIFAKQLDYLFWGLAASGFALGRLYSEEQELQEVSDPCEEDEQVAAAEMH